MEATSHYNIPRSIHELAELIRKQLPERDCATLAGLLVSDNPEADQGDYEEPTQEQLVEEIRQSIREVNLIKQGKAKGRPIQELLDEL